MPQRLFTLEVLAAKHGDCLMLHWGKPQDPCLLLIDGGPPGVYKSFLKKRLEQLRAKRGSPLILDMVMLSHIDEDHIAGLLDFSKEVLARRQNSEPAHFEIDQLWFNTFDDIVGNVEVAAFHASPLAFQNTDGNVPGSALATIASVGQGRSLRDWAIQMSTEVNSGERLITGGYIWDLGAGLSLQVLGPSPERLKEFQTAWDKEVKAKGWDQQESLAEVAAYVDKSPYNLASTVALAQCGSKSILLTGDARGDDIIAGLREGGLLNGNSCKVDVLKVPHHGSDNNVSTEFFRTVLADHYVISGDGRHGNPEIATLQMIRDARGSARYKVHSTYKSTRGSHKTKLSRFLNELSANEKKKFVFRNPQSLSMKIDLAAALGD